MSVIQNPVKMVKLMFFFLIIVNISLQIVAVEEIRNSVMQNLGLLEDNVYLSVNSFLLDLVTQLEDVIAEFSGYQEDAIDNINSHLQSINSDVESLSEVFFKSGIKTDICSENLDKIISDYHYTNVKNIKNVVSENIITGHKILSNTRTLFMMVRNKTVEMKFIVQHCLMLEDDENDCLIDCLDEIIALQNTLPTIISTTAKVHGVYLTLLNEKVVAILEHLIIESFENYVEVLNDFLFCVTQIS